MPKTHDWVEVAMLQARHNALATLRDRVNNELTTLENQLQNAGVSSSKVKLTPMSNQPDYLAAAPKKRTMSPEGRARIAAASRARWAMHHKQQKAEQQQKASTAAARAAKAVSPKKTAKPAKTKKAAVRAAAENASLHNRLPVEVDLSDLMAGGSDNS